MKKRVSFLSLLCSLALVNTASAEHEFYGGATVDYSSYDTTETLHNDFGSGEITSNFKRQFSPSLLIGYRYHFIRTELAVSFEKNEYKTFEIQGLPLNENNSWKLALTTAMFNTLVDIPIYNSFRIVPYIGAGAGLANVSIQNSTETANSTNTFAYQGLAGLDYRYTDQMHFMLGYRYIMVKETELEIFNMNGGPSPEPNPVPTQDSFKLKGSVVNLGFRYDF